MHQKALRTATEPMLQYWGDRFRMVIAEAGVSVVKVADQVLNEQLIRLEEIYEALETFRQDVEHYRSFYTKSPSTTMFQELPIVDDLDTLLHPYLGKTHEGVKRH